MLNKLLEEYRGLNKQLKSVFWFTLVGFLQRGMSIITTPIFTRILSTEDYGNYSVFNAYYSVAVIVVTLYLHMGVIDNAFVKSGKPKERVVSSFQSLACVTSVIWFVVAYVYRAQLSNIMGLPVIEVVVMFFAFIFVEPYNSWVIYKRYQYDYVKPLISSILITVFTPLISVIAVFITTGNQGIARTISYVTVNTIIPGGIFYLVNYKKDHTFYDSKLWKYALGFSIPLLGHYLSETLLNQTDRIMINWFYGSGKAGIYSVAYSVASFMTIFSSALNTAFIPWTYQKLQDNDYRTIEKIGYTVLVFLGGILFTIILFAPEVITVLAGANYTEGLYLIPTLTASAYFGYMYQLFSRVEFYYEKKIYTVISTVAASVLNIILNALWIPRFGFTAAGYSTLISHMLFCGMHYLFFRKVCHENLADGEYIYRPRNLLLISIVVLTISFLVTILYDFLLLRLLVAGVILMTVVLMRGRIYEMVNNIRGK